MKGPDALVVALAGGAALLVVSRYAPDMGGGAGVSNQIQAMAAAIARAEGFTVSGSIGARANNPGNLVLPGSSNTIGPEGITVFATAADGWRALYNQLQAIVDGRSLYSLDWTIAQMGDHWAPPATNPGGYWAINVAAALGVSTNTRLRDVLT
jgi:hypothetical protein